MFFIRVKWLAITKVAKGENVIIFIYTVSERSRWKNAGFNYFRNFKCNASNWCDLYNQSF